MKLNLNINKFESYIRVYMFQIIWFITASKLLNFFIKSKEIKIKKMELIFFSLTNRKNAYEFYITKINN